MLPGIPSIIAARAKAGYVVSDSDAQAFLTVTGITDSTISQYIDELVIAFKASGAWAACIAIYPFVGGLASTHKYNLKDPQDTDGAFRLSFSGTWNHTATGADPNGSTGYANTHIVPSTHLNLNDVHSSYYSRQNTAFGTEYNIGVYDTSSNKEFALIIRRPGDVSGTVIYDEAISIVVVSVSDGSGYFMNSRTSSTSHNYLRNGSSIGSSANANSGTRPTLDTYIGCANINGTPTNFTDKECAFITFGTGIDSSLAATMYTDIQAFQTALGRQV